MYDDLVHELVQHGRRQFREVRVPSGYLKEFFGPPAVLAVTLNGGSQPGDLAFQALLLILVLAGEYFKAFGGESAGHLVLVEPFYERVEFGVASQALSEPLFPLLASSALRSSEASRICLVNSSPSLIAKPLARFIASSTSVRNAEVLM